MNIGDQDIPADFDDSISNSFAGMPSGSIPGGMQVCDK